MQTFQQRIKQAFDDESERRKAAGAPKLTKTMIWKTAGKSSGACSHWFGGGNGMDLDTCFRVAGLLNVNPHWLFSGKGPMRQDSAKNSTTGNVLTISETRPERYGALTSDEQKIIDAFRLMDEEARYLWLHQAERKIIGAHEPIRANAR